MFELQNTENQGSRTILSWGRKLSSWSRTVHQLIEKASEVVVFGSRAAGVHTSSSDLDLLFVTDWKKRIDVPGLDCVVLNRQEVEDSFWLGSELASHVAHYGKWIKGTGGWRDSVRISERAMARKQHRVTALIRNATQRWPQLHPVFRIKYAVMTRRELQRLELLMKRLPIPPTAILDAEWAEGPRSLTDLLAVADFYRAPTIQLTSEFRTMMVSVTPSPPEQTALECALGENSEFRCETG